MNKNASLESIKEDSLQKNIRKKFFKRLLSDNYETIKLKFSNLDIQIQLPITYLLTEYNKNISNYGIIQYSNYPLLSPFNKNFSENVISINLYNSNFEKQKVEGLSTPIDIIIKKPHESFNNCLFIDPEKNYNWNDKGCKAQNLGKYLLCSCNHLTEFSISNYNPVNLLKDIGNVLKEAWIINNFEDFKDLNFQSAKSIYIFSGIIIIYFFGLIFTMKFDKKDIHDKLIYEVERDPGCCDNEETLESIKEIKQIADEAEEKRLRSSLRYIEASLDKYKLDTIIAKTLNLDVIIPEKISTKTDTESNYNSQEIFANQDSFQDEDRCIILLIS